MTVANMHQKRHRLRKLRGETAYVDATPAREHLAVLLAAGWSMNSVAGVSGAAATSLSKIYRGEQGSCRADLIARVTALRPDALADRTTGGTEPFVPRTGTVRRIQALMYLGWTAADMRAHSGLNTHNLLNQEGRWVTRSTHDAIAAMYRELCTRQGPSPHAAGRAKKRGYVGPLAWDNIDRDPEPFHGLGEVLEDDVDPVVVDRLLEGRRVDSTRAEKVEAMRRWLAAGRSEKSLCDAHGWKYGRYVTRETGAA